MESHARDLEQYVSVARNKRRRAKALLDFERHDDDELGFRKNDIITVSIIYVVIPGVEERPNGITVHSLPPTGRRGGFNSNTTARDLLYQKVVVAHGLLGLSRLSNRKGIKTILPFETNTKSLEESPASPSTTGCRSPQVRPSVHSQRLERSASSVCMHFPFIGSVTSRSRTTSE